MFSLWRIYSTTKGNFRIGNIRTPSPSVINILFRRVVDCQKGESGSLKNYRKIAVNKLKIESDESIPE